MKDQDIQQLITSGVFMEEKVVNKLINLDNDRFNLVINKIKKQKPTIITESVFFNLLPKTPFIIKEMDLKETKTIQDITKQLNFKYSTIQKIILEKSDIKNIFSIKNLGNNKVSLIGLVKSVKDMPENNIIELEDQTGSITASISKLLTQVKIKEDEVVGVSGKLNGEIFEVEEIIWPDVPLRVAIKGSGKMVFISNTFLDDKILQNTESADYVFIKNCNGLENFIEKSSAQWITSGSSFTKNNITVVKNPSIVEVGGLKVLFYFNNEPATDVVRRRFATIDGLDFVIDVLPDIIFTDVEDHINYKSITIIGNGIVDASTRDINKVL